jgi:hypothetical protein
VRRGIRNEKRAFNTGAMDMEAFRSWHGMHGAACTARHARRCQASGLDAFALPHEMTMGCPLCVPHLRPWAEDKGR